MQTWTRDAIIAVMRDEYQRTGVPPSAVTWRRGAYGRPNQETVRRRFGTWNTAMRAAGIPLNRPGPKRWWTKTRIVEAMLDWVMRVGRWPSSYEWRQADPRGRWPSDQHVKETFGSWRAAKVAAGWSAAEDTG